MLTLYSLGVRLYHLLIYLASPFNRSAANWISGRKDLFKKLSSFKPVSGKTVWIHCASLGEFEQARPLIELLKQEEHATIVLSFFSPSGYKIRSNYQGADLVTYLPIDYKSNAKKFLDLIKPDVAIFVKYEFWLNFIQETGKRGIPLYLVCGLFRNNHFLFKLPGKLLLPVMKSFTHFHLQDKQSAMLLNEQGFSNTTISGDTRFDRVLEIASKSNEIPLAKEFAEGSVVIVAGSTWEPDEDLLKDFLAQASSENKRYKLIIAPHHIDEPVIERIQQKFKGSVRFSSGIIFGSDVLIIDNIGMLSSLYRYAGIAYVGGGFGKAVHNVLEPSAYNIPVLFGPENRKFREIQLLKENGLGFEIHSSTQMMQVVDQLYADNTRMKKLSEKMQQFMMSNSGAVRLIMQDIRGKLH